MQKATFTRPRYLIIDDKQLMDHFINSLPLPKQGPICIERDDMLPDRKTYQLLAVEVLQRAFKDAQGKVEYCTTRFPQEVTEEAKGWLMSKDIEYWCALAGVNPDLYRSYAQKRIAV